MKISIEINGVLRDTLGKFKQSYEKHLIEDYQDEFNGNQTYLIDESGELEENQSIEPFEYKFISSVTSLDLSKHFAFRSNEELHQFMYEEYVMEIFGHAPSTEMTSFNFLNDLYLNLRDEHEITIISDEMGKSKPATLFFLSKFGCLVERVIFYNSFTKDKILTDFDLVVTSNPDIIINYSNNVSIIKFETEYNKHIDSKNTITSIKDLESIITNILNAETIQ